MHTGTRSWSTDRKSKFKKHSCAMPRNRRGLFISTARGRNSMYLLLKLHGHVDRPAPIHEDDTLQTKAALKALGYYKTPG